MSKPVSSSVSSVPSVVAARLQGTIAAVESLHAPGVAAKIAAMGERLVECLRNDGTLYTAGNGGSASQALHLAEELIGRYKSNRPPLRAICLNADPTALTCIANDFGFDQVFARQCEALLRESDILAVFSTSGASPNIIAALEAAREAGATTFGLLGRDGGPCAKLCDHAIIVPEKDTAHIQESHLVVLHLLCEIVEGAFKSG